MVKEINPRFKVIQAPSVLAIEGYWSLSVKGNTQLP